MSIEFYNNACYGNIGFSFDNSGIGEWPCDLTLHSCMCKRETENRNVIALFVYKVMLKKMILNRNKVYIKDICLYFNDKYLENGARIKIFDFIYDSIAFLDKYRSTNDF